MPRSRHDSRPAVGQEAVMAFLLEYKQDRRNDGNSPTYAEIAAGIGRSVMRVAQIVQRLVAKGELTINERGKICVPDGQYIIDRE